MALIASLPLGRARALLTLWVALLLVGCSTGAGRPQPDLRADPLDGLDTAIAAQCALARPPEPWPALCPQWRLERAALHAWLARRFEARALLSPQGRDEGLITGYYEPEIEGSRTRESDAQVPLLARPAPASAEARMTRTEIERGAPVKLKAIVWIDDPVDAIFVQVQGSGRVRLRDGSVMRVGYAGDNGHPYRAIGRDLIEQGELSAQTLSAQAIMDWLRREPARGRELMRRNPRYVFFRELPAGLRAGDGPIGSMGVALTALRSVAVDPRAVPPGSLLWLEVADPRGGVLRRVVVAQDAGAAITGSPRADLYWGTGAQAGQWAGQMKTAGRLWLLQPRP